MRNSADPELTHKIERLCSQVAVGQDFGDKRFRRVGGMGDRVVIRDDRALAASCVQDFGDKRSRIVRGFARPFS